MPNALKITGNRFERLVVLGDAEPQKGRRRVLCRCDCGNKVVVDPRQLSFGKTRSCGCLQRERAAEGVMRTHVTHGMRHSPEFDSWQKLRDRCNNPANKKYSDYGGRGIRVCDAWADSFEAFYADMGPRPEGTNSVDRLDVNGDYTPANCRWASPKDQARNKRNNRLVTHDGVDMPLSQACEMAGVNYRTALYRLNTGRSWMPAAPALRDKEPGR